MIARRLFSPIASVCACAVHQQQFSCRVLAASKRAYSSASVGDQQAERRGNHRSRRRRWLLGAALGIALGITWHFDSIENYSADYIILYSRFAKQFLSAWAIIRSRTVNVHVCAIFLTGGAGVLAANDDYRTSISARVRSFIGLSGASHDTEAEASSDAASTSTNLPTYTAADVAKHHTPEQRLWISYKCARMCSPLLCSLSILIVLYSKRLIHSLHTPCP